MSAIRSGPVIRGENRRGAATGQCPVMFRIVGRLARKHDTLTEATEVSQASDNPKHRTSVASCPQMAYKCK